MPPSHRIQSVQTGYEYVVPRRYFNYTTEVREIPGKDAYVSFTKNENLFQKGSQASGPGEFLLFIKPDQIVKVTILTKENMVEYRVMVVKEDLTGNKLDKFDCLITSKRLFGLLSDEEYLT